MVAPVSTPPVNVTALQRPQQTANVNQASNRQTAQTVLDSTPVKAKTNAKSNITLASANTQPQSNLPRGSIVDKLV